MGSAMTFDEVEELVRALPPHEQAQLVQRLSDRLSFRQDYFVRAEAFLGTCLDDPVQSRVSLDAGSEIAEMRDERGSELA